MAKGKLFTITDEIRNIARDAFDDMINQLGRSCTLHYNPVWEDCPNCEFDFNTQRSANRWITGGPMKFPSGSICPMCGGEGQFKAETPTEEITMSVESDPKEWLRLGLEQLVMPDGTIFTKGFIKDLPKVNRSVFMTVDSQDGQPKTKLLAKYEYELLSEPVDVSSIVQGRYFVALWKRRAS